MASRLELLLLGLALALGWAGQAEGMKKFPPTLTRGDTCPGYCTCNCMPPPSPRPPPPSPRPPSPSPPRPPSPSPPKPPSPRPPRPPRPSPPKPPRPPPPPPPPRDPPPGCPYNRLRPNIVNCSQKPDILPFKLDNKMYCYPMTTSEGKKVTYCEFTLISAPCLAEKGCSNSTAAKTLYLLGLNECFSSINEAMLVTPTESRKVFAHYDANSCLIKYTLTSSPAGVPVGTKVKVMLPRTGACSDMLTLCRPGAWADAPFCFAAMASVGYDECPFQQVKVM